MSFSSSAVFTLTPLPNMSVEGWVRWFRSRQALPGVLTAVVFAFVCGYLDRSETDFYINGLPADLPSVIKTPEQRVLYARLLPVLAVVTRPVLSVAFVLLAGVLWSRAMRSARMAFVPTVVMFSAMVIPLAKMAIGWSLLSLDPGVPDGFFEFYVLVNRWERRAYLIAFCLVALGFLALFIRVFQDHVLQPAALHSGPRE